MNDTPEMAEWKRKHGITPEEPVNHDELRMRQEDSRSLELSWCFGCDKHMMIREMKIVTRRDDPYLQIDESDSDYIAEDDRVRMCSECHREKYGEVLP